MDYSRICEGFIINSSKFPIFSHLKHPPKIILLGSGGLSIGQAGEFDYSGNQAIKAFREAGIHVVLINPNIATVQTNPSEGVTVYLYPIETEWVEHIIEKEKPDGIVAGFGGQTALNCVLKLQEAGILKKHNILNLGTDFKGLRLAENREEFSKHIEKIGMPVLPSRAVSKVEDAISAGKEIGYPVIIRAAYALGGLGSGIANNQSELKNLAELAFVRSDQILIEKSLWGWKELEYEVMRDQFNNSIAICNMENIDPLGIHTGDSIVVAPSQTLSDDEYQTLRTAALKIASSLEVIGECNVQFALNPVKNEFYVIEVNPRLSRSSALASKATGYPIAYIAAQVILGNSLLNITNPVTGVTCALFEPSMDYIAIKVPRWDLQKFHNVSHQLGSAMKSVGEVMAIGRNLGETFQKAIRMVNENAMGITRHRVETDSFEVNLKNPTETRIFSVIDAFRFGYKIDEIYAHSFIDKWFLFEFQKIVEVEKEILGFFRKPNSLDFKKIESGTWKRWKTHGFSDVQIAAYALQYDLTKSSGNNPPMSEIYAFSLKIREARIKSGIKPVAKRIDTSAGEYPTSSNYFYLTYNGDFNDEILGSSEKKSALVIGCGPYRIGTSVEFDWCGVESSKTMGQLGWSRTVVNCNPETVSTDYNSSDILFFEEMSIERLLDILDINQTDGVIGCMGGQAPNSLALKLSDAKIQMFGHSAESIEKAENRSKFSKILDELEIDQPRWCSATSRFEIDQFIKSVGFPVLVRPSYVLSGAAMKVAYDFDSLNRFLDAATEVSSSCPVVISEFMIDAKEIEMDGVSKNGQIIKSFLSEHVENAGIHSGDATLIYPTQSLSSTQKTSLNAIGESISKALNLNGPFNIQFLLRNNKPMVIECNARASRSFPFISKVSGINLAKLATQVILAPESIDLNKSSPKRNEIGVKSALFSFSRLKGADPISGVEMVSTGEVACVAECVKEALLLSLQSSFFKKPRKGILVSSGRDIEKEKFLNLMPFLEKLGVNVYATSGTAAHLSSKGHKVHLATWPHESGRNNVINLIQKGKVDLVINVPKNYESSEINAGLEIRHAAIQNGCTLLTNMEKTVAFLEALEKMEKGFNQPKALLPFD